MRGMRRFRRAIPVAKSAATTPSVMTTRGLYCWKAGGYEFSSRNPSTIHIPATATGTTTTHHRLICRRWAR